MSCTVDSLRPLSTVRLCQPPNARQQTTCPLSTNHYQCHDGAVTVRSVSSCLAKIDITDDLSALVVQYAIGSATYCTTLTLVCGLFVERTVLPMAADRPRHAAHTVGNGVHQVPRTNSGIRSLPVLVSADLLVPIHEQDHSDTATPPGQCLFAGRPLLVYSSICTWS